MKKYLAPVLAVIFWGNSFIATKRALLEISPVTIIILRLLLAVILLTIIAVYLKRDFRINLSNHGKILLLALVAVFHLWIQITGLKYTTAANTGWIIGTAPVFIAVLGMIFFKEKMNGVKITGIIIAMAGLMLLISKGDLSGIDFISNKGDFLVLFSAFTWGVYSIINKKISLTYSPLMTILYLFIMMTVLIIPFNLSEETINSVFHLSAVGWISVIFLGVFCSGIAYVLWAYSLQQMESSSAGAFLYFEPFVTVTGAWLFLQEIITPLMIVSGLIITAGVVLVNKE